MLMITLLGKVYSFLMGQFNSKENFKRNASNSIHISKRYLTMKITVSARNEHTLGISSRKAHIMGQEFT